MSEADKRLGYDRNNIVGRRGAAGTPKRSVQRAGEPTFAAMGSPNSDCSCIIGAKAVEINVLNPMSVKSLDSA